MQFGYDSHFYNNQIYLCMKDILISYNPSTERMVQNYIT